MRRLCRMTCAHSGSSARCRIADAEVAGMRGHTARFARQVRWHTRPRPLRSTPYGLGEGEHTVMFEEEILIVIERAGVHTESALTILAEVVRISVTAIWTSMPMILSFVNLWHAFPMRLPQPPQDTRQRAIMLVCPLSIPRAISSEGSSGPLAMQPHADHR